MVCWAAVCQLSSLRILWSSQSGLDQFALSVDVGLSQFHCPSQYISWCIEHTGHSKILSSTPAVLTILREDLLFFLFCFLSCKDMFSVRELYISNPGVLWFCNSFFLLNTRSKTSQKTIYKNIHMCPSFAWGYDSEVKITQKGMKRNQFYTKLLEMGLHRSASTSNNLCVKDR